MREQWKFRGRDDDMYVWERVDFVPSYRCWARPDRFWGSR